MDVTPRKSSLDMPMVTAPTLFGVQHSPFNLEHCLVAATKDSFEDRHRVTFCGRQVMATFIVPLLTSTALCTECAQIASEIARVARGPALPAGWTPSP